MSHTFEGRSCWIHYNSDLSGDVEIVKRNRVEVQVPGSDLLAFFRHPQEPGRVLSEEWKEGLPTGLPENLPTVTAAGYIREQIERLRKLEPEMKSFGIGSERWAAVAMAIGTLAEKLHAVEREVKDDA